ncbi:MAG TPA: response regulator transcription factor [Anaerolineales bacterium]|nr:response regulator transcription factor [Anaerolineales bacterium]HRQ91435.1 response regulator transcription factor [Anaerolineales bacterium]
MPKISLVVVEDHPIFRQGLVDAFAIEDDFNVVGQAAEGNEGLALIKKLAPDVALVDVNLPNINGQQLTRTLKNEKKTSTRVVLLTAYDDSSQVIHAMAAGAAAYCVKDIDPLKLLEVVRAVASGNFVVGDQVLDQPALQRWLGERSVAGRAYSDPGEPFEPLSSREMEVLECVTRGMSNKEIATHLDISHQTVKNHVTAVLRKLNVEDRTQAAVYALRRGWVRLYDDEKRVEE